MSKRSFDERNQWIVASRASGMTYKRIAELHGISANRVRDIVERLKRRERILEERKANDANN